MNNKILISRSTIVKLIKEVYDENLPLFTSPSGTFTAGQMIQEILDGTDLGRDYASELLRVSRDFLSRQARNKKESAAT